MAHLFPALTATRLQATTYLLGIALFSISFLVFLNSSISFVVTDVIGRKEQVGDAVGTLGFADELLALVACPLWGLLSDRIGVKAVAVIGYVVVGISLIGLVQSRNVYPELLLGRLGFSIGGAACSTMVTAVLPAMVAKRAGTEGTDGGRPVLSGHSARLHAEERPATSGSVGHCATPSVSSELTITPGRFASRSPHRARTAQLPASTNEEHVTTAAGTSQLAGYVGMFTGLGALLALVVFLPLPKYLQGHGETPAGSLQMTFYVVGGVAICVAIFIFFGLRGLPGEAGKNLYNLFRPLPPTRAKRDFEANGHEHHGKPRAAPTYLSLVSESVSLGFTDTRIGLGFLGGFVARASSVGISLFIPLFVNAYYIRKGLCDSAPNDPTSIKESCKDAYTVAAGLTGISQTAALICAPLFGWLGGRVGRGRSEWPLLGAAAVGVLGFTAFGLLPNPDAFHSKGGEWTLLAVIAIGISQIGAIVCSLSLLSRGINDNEAGKGYESSGTSNTVRQTEENGRLESDETAALLPNLKQTSDKQDRSHLKGSIAGVYSLTGGAGILLLTKLGGVLFDRWNTGAPFFMLAIFNAILLVAVALVGGGTAIKRGSAE